MRLVPAMVDMRHSEEDKKEEAAEYGYPSLDTVPDYPRGLCIYLGEDELEKLGLDDEDVEPGDMIHFHAMALVTSVSKSANTTSEPCCRIELQITHMSAEDEEEEDEENEEAEDSGGRLSKLYL